MITTPLRQAAEKFRGQRGCLLTVMEIPSAASDLTPVAKLVPERMAIFFLFLQGEEAQAALAQRTFDISLEPSVACMPTGSVIRVGVSTEIRLPDSKLPIRMDSLLNPQDDGAKVVLGELTRNDWFAIAVMDSDHPEGDPVIARTRSDSTTRQVIRNLVRQARKHDLQLDPEQRDFQKAVADYVETVNSVLH